MWFFQAIQSLLPISDSLAHQIQHFCIDSRQAKPGSLFFALPGKKVNGHHFLTQAFELGALVAVVEQQNIQAPKGLTLVYVPNVKETLQKMAQHVVLFWKPKIIGITGSLGKTATKEFVVQILQAAFSVSYTPLSYNSQLTLPLTILNAKQATEYLVLEMGVNQPKEIERLLEIAPPRYSILTMLAHVHIVAFETFENLAQSKMKIFQSQNVELGLYNLDMPFAAQVGSLSGPKMVSYSLKNPEADYYLKKQGSLLEIFKNKQSLFQIASPFFDYKSHYNLLAAIAMADCLKIPLQKIAQSAATVKNRVPNRLEKIEKKNVTIICDAFNSNLDSVENALEVIGSMVGRKIVILSDLVEQGIYLEQNHRKLAQLGISYADILIGYGERLSEMRNVCRKSQKRWAFFLSYSSMLAYISKLIRKGDVILLKGSRERALERIIDDLDFDTITEKS